MKNANPDISVTDLAKLQGASWKELEESKKQKYVDLAAQDVLRYKAEMEEGGFFEIERVQKEKDRMTRLQKQLTQEVEATKKGGLFGGLFN